MKRKGIKIFLLLFCVLFSGCVNEKIDSSIVNSINHSLLLSEVNNLTLNDSSFVYDGNPHSLEIEGTLPSGVKVEYCGNERIKVGEYEVSALLIKEDSNELLKKLTANLFITKANLNGISFEGKTIEYDGNLHSLEIEGELPQGVTVSYFGNGKENVGTYEILAYFNDSTGNYNVTPLTASLTITKAKLNVEFNDKTVYYDGNPHSIEIEGTLPAGVSVEYIGNNNTAIGDYLITAKFFDSTGNYLTEDLTAILSIVEYIPEVKDAVSYLSDNFTIAYSVSENGIEKEYKNALERLTLIGAEGNLAYFSEYNEFGYYITKEDSYIIYNNGYGKPIYNTNGKLSNEEVASFESLIDLKGNFSKANWELMNRDTTNEFKYKTSDLKVINTASFLTDDSSNNVSSVVVTITKKSKNYKVTSFITYDANGNEIKTANIQRVGGTFALDYVPTLDDSLDETLKTRWMITTNFGNNLGKQNDMFEITNDNKLIVYNMDEEGNYTKNSNEYIFLAPKGDGSYIFIDANNNQALIQYYGDNLLLKTIAIGSEVIKYDVCTEYYTYGLKNAIEYFGYKVEEMDRNDELYSDMVLGFEGAIRAYYVYSVTTDPTTGKEIIVDYIVVTQFLNQEKLIEEYCEGDISLYNGCALGGLIYGNFIVTMASSQEATKLMSNVTSIIPPSYVEFDGSKYLAPIEGQSALDYMITYMTNQGYEYMNKEKAAANPSFSINTTSSNPEGLNFKTEISKYLEQYSTIVDGNGNEVSSEDFYIFYKENINQSIEEGDEYFYAGFLVCDREIVGSINFYDNVYLVPMGYFFILGDMYGALETWQSAQSNFN